jgi:hypothetical protein
MEARDPDLIELIEIRGPDRQELGPFQQGDRGVFGERNHPGVEFQPGKLTVQVSIGHGSQAILIGFSGQRVNKKQST